MSLMLVLTSALVLRNASVMDLAANNGEDGPTLPPQPWGEKWTLPYRQKMHNTQNTQYAADIDIGPHRVQGIFDTGSFELLVLSERCDHCHATPYDHADSATFRPNGTVVQHVFGSGPCLSMKGYEQVAVGPLTAPNTTFYEIVRHEIPVFETASFTAIVGLGDGPNEEDRSLLQMFGVNEFSICLERGSGAPGWLTWGGGLTPEQRKSATSLNVVGQHHWAVIMTGFGTHGNPVTCGGKGCGAILDSGTSLIAAPGQALMALSQALPAIAEDCSNMDELPDLVFMLDGKELTLPPEAYVLRMQGTLVESSDVWQLLYFKPKITVMDQCLPAFMQIDRTTQLGPLWILGMPFFRFFHSTFHMDKEHRDQRTVLITPADDECMPAPATNATEHEEAVLAAEKRDAKDEKAKPAFVVRKASKSRGKQTPLAVDVANLVPPILAGSKDALQL